MNYSDRMVRDLHTAGGQPVFKGTRVTLRTVLSSLAEGASTAEILADFPTLSERRCAGRHRVCRHVPTGRPSVTGVANEAVKIKLDENLPERLVTELSELRHFSIRYLRST